jgi:DNA-binding beta-propeller fold protein YncE
MESVTHLRSRRPTYSGLLLLCTLVLYGLPGLILPTPLAHADGGAPNLAYIAGAGRGVVILDIAQQKMTGEVALGGAPSMLYLTLDGRFLYVAQPGLNQVSMLDTGTLRVVCSVGIPGQPSLLAFDAGAHLLYVAGNGAATITVLADHTCTIQHTLAVASPVYGLATAEVGPGPNGGDGNQLWFTTADSLNVYTRPGRIQSIPIPGHPQYITIPPGATVYTATREGTVVAVNLETLQPLPPLLTGGVFGPMDFNVFTGEIYVPDKKQRTVDVLTPIYAGNGLPHEPNHVIALDDAPQSVAITADGNLGLFALAGGRVALFDIPGKQVGGIFAVGGSPRFIITGLYPPVTRNAESGNTNGSSPPTSTLVLLAVLALLLLAAIALLILLVRLREA